MTNRVVIVVDDNLASRMLPAIILRSLPLQVRMGQDPQY
jgi:hypothetical protein